MAGSPRCRTIGCVSRGWVGLPPDFHWAKNSEKPQDSEFSQQRLRELLESSLRSPEDNLPEAPPIPGIRYVMDGSLIIDKLELHQNNLRQQRCPTCDFFLYCGNSFLNGISGRIYNIRFIYSQIAKLLPHGFYQFDICLSV